MSQVTTTAIVVGLGLLGSFLPGSGFVRMPSTLPQHQGAGLRRAVTATVRSCFTTPRHPRSITSGNTQAAPGAFDRIARVPGAMVPLRVAGTNPEGAEDFESVETVADSTDPLESGPDIIDPLEAGPDVDPLEAGPDPPAAELPEMAMESLYDEAVATEEDMLEGSETYIEGNADLEEAEEEPDVVEKPKARRKRRKVTTADIRGDFMNTPPMDVTNAMREKGGAVKRRRRKVDPLWPKMLPIPIDWNQRVNMGDGCRGLLIVIHRGTAEDKALADKFRGLVDERFGPKIKIFEDTVEMEGMTKEDVIDSNAFEIWMESCECTPYHQRATTGEELTDEYIQNILDDIAEQVSDEAILIQRTSVIPYYKVPGFDEEHAIRRASTRL